MVALLRGASLNTVTRVPKSRLSHQQVEHSSRRSYTLGHLGSSCSRVAPGGMVSPPAEATVLTQ